MPEGLKYAASHEWAKVDGDVATVGITDHAQAELGDVVFVELPDVGTALDAGDTFGVVESVKAASDVYSPISGEVVEINEELVDEPAKVRGLGGGGVPGGRGGAHRPLPLRPLTPPPPPFRRSTPAPSARGG